MSFDCTGSVNGARTYLSLFDVFIGLDSLALTLVATVHSLRGCCSAAAVLSAGIICSRFGAPVCKGVECKTIAGMGKAKIK